MSSRLAKSETAETYEAIYMGGYDKNYPSVDLVRLERWYFGGVPGRSLDYGCGPGTNGLHLLDNGHEVVFCDVARAALKKVEEKLDRRPEDVASRAQVRPIELDADNLPDDDKSYDYVICLSVLSNLESEEAVRHLVSEFFRVLKPGGKFLADINAPDTSFVNDSSSKAGDNTMYCPESEQDFAAMVSDAGFKIDDVGHSSFSYQEHIGFEYIVCARKPG